MWVTGQHKSAERRHDIAHRAKGKGETLSSEKTRKNLIIINKNDRRDVSLQEGRQKKSGRVKG